MHKLKKGTVIHGLTLLKPTLKALRRKNRRVVPAWICEEEGTGKLVTLSEMHILRRTGRKNPWQSTMRAVYTSYRDRCIRDNLYWGISLDEFKELTAQKCHYCQKPPANCYRKVFVYNGLDRKNNSAGYSLSNVVPCCRDCNYMKGDQLSYEEMLVAMTAVVNLRLEKRKKS